MGPGRPCVFSAMVGMARCAVPARVVAGGTNIRAVMAFEGVAPLHAARTSRRDVPTELNRYPVGRVRAVLFEMRLFSGSCFCTKAEVSHSEVFIMVLTFLDDIIPCASGGRRVRARG